MQNACRKVRGVRGTEGSDGLVPLALRQNDILTSEKCQPSHTIWKKDVVQMLHKIASFVHFLLSDSFSFRSVPFKGSLHVRPDTLWSYVLTPSRRTCKHPLDVRPQSQGRTFKGFLAEEFDVLCLSGAISSLSEKRVFSGCGQPRWVLSHSQGVSECQNESKKKQISCKNTKGRTDIAGFTHKSIK